MPLPCFFNFSITDCLTCSGLRILKSKESMSAEKIAMLRLPRYSISSGGWRSGIIMLCLGLLATTPVGSTVPGLILAIMAVQLIVGRAEPVFPHFIMTRRLPTRQLLRLSGHAIHVLKYLEKAVHPRWPMTFEVAKRAVSVMVLLLTVVLLLTPVPLSNVAPAMVISLISLAYVEQDGLLLSAAFLTAIILIGIGSAAVWGTIVSAVLISA
jgi:hypothetical protein